LVACRIDVDYEDPGANQTVFARAMCSLFAELQVLLPRAIVTVSFYGNPNPPATRPGQRQTLPLYQKLLQHDHNKCASLVSWVNYQDYANWAEGEATNVKMISETVRLYGENFGWEKLVWCAAAVSSPHGCTWQCRAAAAAFN
jgi:hypothetical protein